MDALQEALSLLDGGYAAEAIAALERAPTSVPATLLRARAELALDRFDHAHASLRSIFRRDDVASKHRAHALVLQAVLLRRSSPLYDEALDSALRGATGAMRAGDPALAAEAHVEAARLLAAKRSRELAEAQLARAIERAGATPAAVLAGLLACADAEVKLSFDDRPGALERYRAAATPGSAVERTARIGSANVEMLLGHFDLAHAELAQLLPLRSGESAARRLLVRLHLARHQWAEAAQAVEEGLRQNPLSDFRFRDRYERACALYRAGFFAHAKPAFDELGAMTETSRWIDLAKRNARLLGRGDLAQRRWFRLQTFPTVAQLRSHCGPAACELYLRYFGLPASQLEIARAIKEPDGGTPIYRMRSYLEQAGFHTRRVEAELPVLRRILEAQIPVIMEEDYSSSGHVAVAIGYDDIRDVLEVQDPMSHEIRETPYEDLARLRDLSNHGALVAVPRNDPARIAQLDAIGAVECRYMSLVDEAWAAYDAEEPERGDTLVDESIALRRDYELARFYQFQRAIEIARKAPTPDARVKVHQVVGEVVAMWPDDAWPHRLRGEALAGEGRYGEALTSFQRARERDKLDPRTWASIAMCEMALGKDDDAYATLKEALRLDPSHPGANGRLASLALDRGEIDRAEVLNEVARRRAPNVAYHQWVHARILQKRGRQDEALAAFDRALTLDPRRAGTRVERAFCLAKLGRVDDAAAYLDRAIVDLPDEKWLRLELARLLYENGRHDRAAATCRAVLDAEPKVAGALVILAASLLASGSPDANAAIDRAFALRPTDGWLYAQIGSHSEARGDHGAAIRAYATALGLRQNDAQSELDLGFALAAGGYGAQGAPYLSRAGQKLDLGEDDLYRVGDVLVASGGSARPFFERVLERRPDEAAPLRAHARIMLELCWAPSLGEASLARLARVAPDDAYARAWRGAQMMDSALEKEADGEKLLRESVAAIPTREYPRRALAERLFQRGRCDEALALVEPCELRHQVSRLRVRALSAMLRFDDADREIARFDAKWGKNGKPSYGARSLRFERLLAAGDYASVIGLAEELGREDGEREDDGRLDFWETVKFECLARLGEGERALRFGERQALDGPSLARLILLAYDVAQLGVAQALAERALRLFPDLLAAQFVMARLAELRGEEPRAMSTYRELHKRDQNWHRPPLAIARATMASGDIASAASASQLGVRAGHLYAESFVVRGQARAMTGDRQGALSDLERAYGMMRADARARDHLDAWALRAQLSGDRSAADMLFQKYLGGTVGGADRLRVQRLRVV
ncbi:MAG TPA: tetratricopeptide repeat protein [Polyangiaceae bacterium]|jgi:tetratricopeptide (TPR) repeat protein